MNALLRILAWTLAIALVALPVVAVLNGWIAGERWPMRSLAVTGEFRQVDETAVRQAAENISPLTEQDVADICASFQEAVAQTLEERLAKSLARFRDQFPDMAEPALVVAGGVAANQRLRGVLLGLTAKHGFAFIAPPMNLCTDNAAMIAWAACERLALGQSDRFDLAPRPRWPLDETASGYGSGKKGPKA